MSKQSSLVSSWKYFLYNNGKKCKQIYIRLATAINTYNVKINNTIGKIDADYYNNPDNEGHVWIKFTNMGNKVWEVKQGEAVAQGTFYKYLIADDDKPIKEERIGGLGSTN